jgi:uncharacterized membrane protein
MDWLFPQALIFLLPAILGVVWASRASSHPMNRKRRSLLLGLRSLLVLLAILALASPALRFKSREQAVFLLLDFSHSQGSSGLKRVLAAADRLRENIAGDAQVGAIAVGREPRLLAYPGSGAAWGGEDDAASLGEEIGADSDFAAAVRLAKGLFPTGASRHLVIVGDGVETIGSLAGAAEEATVRELRIHALPMAGDISPDARVTRLTSSQSRLNEGASLELTASVESSLEGAGRLRLFENGIEVEVRELQLSSGASQEIRFNRVPPRRNIYQYRAVLEGFEGRDAIPENNSALSIVDVRGQPLWLYVEGEESEAHYLVAAMEKEGIRLEVRKPVAMPSTLAELIGYDGILLSDVPAHQLGESRMTAIRDYVEKLGGGFIMSGGMQSFGVGGYYRTPIEEILPVRLKAPDQEEEQTSALALVIDRSGSMSGQKLEICKSAAIATAELLSPKDYLGVYAFDSQVHEVFPMTRVASTSMIANQISLLGSGGGTNIYPGMVMAREKLGEVKAKIKHMIVLTDGQTSGEGYQALASQCHAEGITISTVAVGSTAQVGLLQAIAAAGGGQSYVTLDPAGITRIFTQDTMTHTGRMIREDAFEPKLAEAHPMVRDWVEGEAPPLLGYIKTNRKATAQVPLVTDQGDPLLAQWRFGLGKVTAFTSDCKSRWAGLWVSDWDGYSRLWAQMLRETARSAQGLQMDLQLELQGDKLLVGVDLADDAASWKSGSLVEGECFFLPANALGASMQTWATFTLEQRGPGRYESVLRPSEPGVYLVRAKEGGQVVSAGYVHNPSSEVATGQVNEPLLREVTELTGGTLLSQASDPLVLGGSDTVRLVELWPYLLAAFLVVFLADLIVRRWENALGVGEVIRRVVGR